MHAIVLRHKGKARSTSTVAPHVALRTCMYGRVPAGHQGQTTKDSNQSGPVIHTISADASLPLSLFQRHLLPFFPLLGRVHWPAARPACT